MRHGALVPGTLTATTVDVRLDGVQVTAARPRDVTYGDVVTLVQDGRRLVALGNASVGPYIVSFSFGESWDISGFVQTGDILMLVPSTHSREWAGWSRYFTSDLTWDMRGDTSGERWMRAWFHTWADDDDPTFSASLYYTGVLGTVYAMGFALIVVRGAATATLADQYATFAWDVDYDNSTWKIHNTPGETLSVAVACWGWRDGSNNHNGLVTFTGDMSTWEDGPMLLGSSQAGGVAYASDSDNAYIDFIYSFTASESGGYGNYNVTRPVYRFSV